MKSRKTANISGGKPCEICECITFLQTHHIEGREIPNPNHPSNLVDCCPNCHFAIHHGAIAIEGWFMTSQGRELMWFNKGETSFTGSAPTTHIIGEESP